MSKPTGPSASPATRRRRRRSLLPRIILLWALVMAPLLTWGLPDTRRDELLFGQQPAWKAARYRVESDLQRLSTRPAGADTDLNPLTDPSRINDLTPDDAARAEILRRYRLFSRQPDEMIIFRALQRMNPRQLDLDPRLYQYGGGYLYLVGATFAASAKLGLAHLTGDAGYYLENPAAFARFYMVARVLSLAFGALTLVAVHKLTRRAGGRAAAWIAVVCVACTPVFITAVLEAKPHLPSACLILWATLSALRYFARGRRSDLLRMGLQAGYAFGLVLTGVLAALLWPTVLLARPAAQRGRLLRPLVLAGGVALAVYVATNPYIPYNWLANRAALTSNISNSTAMYRDQIRRTPEGIVRTGQLLIESAGVGVAVAGLAGLGWLLRRRPRETVIAAASGLGMLVLAALLAAGKPAEFARFLILPVLLLCVATACVLAAAARRHVLIGIAATIVVLAALRTPAYVRAFIVDARGDNESRLLAGRYLAGHAAATDAIGLLQEPAPYAVPPLDFAHRQVLLLPAARPHDFDPATLPAWLVFTADDDQVHADAWWQTNYHLVARFPPAATPPSRIAWANKPTFIYERRPDSAGEPAARPTRSER